jgi:hypothetical protein
LKRVDRFLQEQVDQEKIAGAVALVLQDGKPVYEKAFGWADKEANRKMTPDAIFRIASQSKALTSAVILSLVEDGKLGLNEAAGKYIPTFMKTTVSLPTARRSRARRADHDPGSAHAHRRRVVRRRRADRGSLQGEEPGRGDGTRLVHRRQGRADLRHDGAARRRCRSWRSRAKPTSTGTTPTSSAASPRRRRARRSTS